MTQVDNNKVNIEPEEQELDIVELIRLMWINRWFIIKVTICAFVCAVIAVLFSSKTYTASCDVVPQMISMPNSQMSLMANAVGISLPKNNDVRTLSPYVYENIMASAKFCKELVHTELYFKKAGKEVSFYEYYTSPEYNKPTVFGYIKRYTIGLPGVILGAVRKKQSIIDYSTIQKKESPIEAMSRQEYDVVSMLHRSLGVYLDEDKGFVTISATMPEPLAAAQLAQAAVDLLHKYVTEFKIEKVQSNLEFVQQRHDELKREFEQVQAKRARFRDANHNTVKNSARVELERIEAEYRVALNVYSEMALQLEQAKINVKETTPILTIVRPVMVPFIPSSTSSFSILVIFTFLGVVAGMAGVLFIPTIAEIMELKFMKRWIKELPRRRNN
jgi:uncharacterized protein involved in exopolysaccharide biosynthesis